MTPERLAELRDKVRHRFNLLPDEAREVFAHYGEPIEQPRERCAACGGEGKRDIGLAQCALPECDCHLTKCDSCKGTGYEVAK